LLPFLSGENIAVSERDLLDRMISYPCDNPAELNISGDKYILPANCSFLMSNASNLKPLINHAQHNGLYNLLVLDPPWFNKSAKRGSKYSFMSLWQIKSLPVPDLLAPGALVGIWVTNKQKYLRFTKTELFPHWSVELVAEWYWVKVTRKGELVTDLDSPHKKPYEPLLLGRFIAKKDAPGMFGLSVSKSNEPAKERSKFTPHENKSNVLSLRQKRKKMNECDDDDDEVSMTCYISDKNVATTMPQEQTSLSSLKPTTGLNCVACSDHEYEHLDNFLQTVPLQSPRNDFLSCCERYHKNKVDLSDDMESLSDVVMQKEHDEQDVLELYESKCLRVTATDLKIAENVQHTDSIMNSTSKHSELLQRDTRSKDCQLLPHQQIICSVPCKIHSRKPPLNEVLSQYVPHNSLCLEMFARNLTPHWTSWGNEVLRFQGMQYFDHLPPKQETNENAT